MPVCKTCGIKFHACSNCGLYYDWEYNYHCRDCWIKSPEYKEVRIKYMSLMKTLNEAQRTLLKYFLDGRDDFALEYEKWDVELQT
jgi:hypothetical protein